MPEKRLINLFSPTIGTSELESVASVLASGWLGKGQKVAEFEAAWAQHINVDRANIVSVNSCTEALFTAIKLLGIGPGDEVIIPTIHFVGAAQAVIAAGARPVFCDVDSRTLNVATKFILDKTTDKAIILNRALSVTTKLVHTDRTKAIILNHYGGVPPVDLSLILDFCQNKRIRLIEDAACAPASTYNGQSVGTFGDIGVWSFDAMKIITTGDGGMMYIHAPELAARARQWLYLGTESESGLGSKRPQWWEYEVTQLGARRSIMNDIAAAMGIEQLKRLPEFVERRRQIHITYSEELSPFVRTPSFNIRSPQDKLSCYFYWIQTPRRDELAAYLRANGVYTSFRYYPLHWAYRNGDSLPNAEKAARETLLLPLHCNLTDNDVEYICGKVREFFDYLAR